MLLSFLTYLKFPLKSILRNARSGGNLGFSSDSVVVISYIHYLLYLLYPDLLCVLESKIGAMRISMEFHADLVVLVHS